MKDPTVFPENILPQLSTLSQQGPPEGDQWLHEIKYDGFRLLCRKDGARVDFYTRAGHCWGDRLPAIAEEVRRLDCKQAWLDGELVVMMTEEGRSSFGALQHAFAEKDNTKLAFYVFDLMFRDGDLSREPLEARKLALAELVRDRVWNLQYVDYIKGEGSAFFEAVCRQKLEGIVSKRADSCYSPGTRTRTWLKSKYRDYPREIAWEWWVKKER